MKTRIHIAGEDLEPVRRAPSLITLNTFGFKLYGESDYDAKTDSFMVTHFLPLFPIARYRVISPSEGSYLFIGKGKLRSIDRIHLLTFAIILAGFALFLSARG
jgi:hypothetical protein